MEERELTDVRTEADQPDAFLNEWEESPEEEQSDRTETPEAEDVSEDAAEETTEAAEEDAPEPSARQTWTLKHLGEEKTLRAEDISAELLQKGIDYDRVRARYDEAKPALELIGKYASDHGMSVTDAARRLCAEDGLPREQERGTAALAAVPDRRSAAEERAAARAARMQADIAEFAKAFPEAYEQAKRDPDSLPGEVLAAADSGAMTLTAAYARHVADEAEKRARSAGLYRRNAERSTGSLKSAGSDERASDPFLAGLEE